MKIYTADGEERISTVIAREAWSFQHIAGNSVSTNNWYGTNVANNQTAGTFVVTADVLYASPFIAPARSRILEAIGVTLTAGSAGNMRFALYTNTSDMTLYPDARLDESGSVSSGAAQLMIYTISRQLDPGQMYWIAAVFSSTPTVRAVPLQGASHLLGISSALGTAPNTYISVAFAFAQPPATFTAGGTYGTGVAPSFGARFVP